MFDLVVSAIGVPLAKFLVKQWLGDSAGNAVAGGVVDYLKGKLGNERDARRAARQVEELAEAVVVGLVPFFEREQGRGLELGPVMVELQLTLEGRADAATIIEQRLEPQRLAASWIAARPQASRDLSEAQAEAYRASLHGIAASLAAVAARLPRFEVKAAKASLDGLDALARQGKEIETEIRQVSDAIDATRSDVARLRERDDRRLLRVSEHERDYRQALRREVSKLKLFGVDFDESTPKEWPLEIAYVPLRLGIAGHGERLDYETLMALLPLLGGRLLIEGAAGSGKTTLTQWTALQALDQQETSRCRAREPQTLLRSLGPELANALGEAAPAAGRQVLVELAKATAAEPRAYFRREDMTAQHLPVTIDDWRERTPFLIRLRDCEGSLPSPEGLPVLLAKEIGTTPDDWVLATLKNGRALVLLDGIDEIPDGERSAIWEGIRRYFEAYASTLFIVTSRPEAVEGEWLHLFGAARAQAQPMDPTDRDRFIDYWHEAVAVELRQQHRSQHTQGLETDARELAARIRDVPALSQLAETPLLCAAVCFLNRARSGDIPERLDELLRVLVELLVTRLDRDRFGKKQDRFSLAYRALDTKEKITALAFLAQYMLREGKPAVRDEDLLVPLQEALARLPKQIDVTASDILKALKERSGVLRGRSEKTSEFAHNVFRSYLAAQAYAQGTAYGELLDKARQTADPDLPVLAAALGGAGFADRLIEEIRDTARARTEPATGRWLQIMALRCWQTAGASPSLQQAFLEPLLTQEIRHPRTFDEAGWLAELGTRLLPFLHRRAELDTESAAACVRALRLIGGNQASTLLDTYLDAEADEVVEELAQAVNPLRVAKIRSFVSSNHEPWSQYSPLRHLRASDLAILDATVDRLILSGSGLRSAEPLASFAQLQGLWLSGTQVSDLAPLAGLARLQTLSLDGTQVRDLAPLAGLAQLETLALSGTQVSDLAPLAGLARLQTLWLDGTQVSDLAPLAGLARLQGLSLDGTSVRAENPAVRELRSRGVAVGIF